MWKQRIVDPRSDWVLSIRTYRLILVPVWAQMTVGVMSTTWAKIIPIEQQLQLIHWQKASSSEANMAHPLAEYEAGELKRMIWAWEMKIANLQGENKWLKGELKECLERLRKLQWQLLNGDIHRGKNTLQMKEFDSYDHTNMHIISKFCKNKLFPHQKFLHPSWKIYSVRRTKPVWATNVRKRLTYLLTRMVSFIGRTKLCLSWSTRSIARSGPTSIQV